MPSIIQIHAAETATFLKRHRRAYLRSIGAKIGIGDLRDIALREAMAMIEFAASLDAPKHPSAKIIRGTAGNSGAQMGTDFPSL